MTEPTLPAPVDAAHGAPLPVNRPWVPNDRDRQLLEALGRELRSAREAAGLARSELLSTAGDVAGIEIGRHRTRPSRIRAICGAVGVDARPLLDRYADVIAPERPDGKPSWKTFHPDLEAPASEPAEPLPLEPWDRAALGAELWALRERTGLTRPGLAERLGCSRVHIWLVERGEREPSAGLADAWLDATRASDAERTLLALRFPRLSPPSSGRAPKSVRGRTSRHRRPSVQP